MIIQLADTGEYKRLVFDKDGQPVGTVDYESHKGALLVIDECQDHFRPRPSGSAVPDHVAALEVHRHQGLDIWLITQRPGLVDSNVRSLVGRHIALRSTSLGRYKYEWPEAGDIESKFSRDTAARSRYKLPRHVFGLYKSAEVHTETKHKMPFAAKALFFVVPLFGVLLFTSYKSVSARAQPAPVSVASGHLTPAPVSLPAAQLDNVPQGLERYEPKAITGRHPYDQLQFSIKARMTSATRDLFRFELYRDGQSAFSVSSDDLLKAGYSVTAINDCSVKLAYKDQEFFVTCNAPFYAPPLPAGGSAYSLQAS